MAPSLSIKYIHAIKYTDRPVQVKCILVESTPDNIIPHLRMSFVV